MYHLHFVEKEAITCGKGKTADAYPGFVEKVELQSGHIGDGIAGIRFGENPSRVA
jgi:hypothetical protein